MNKRRWGILVVALGMFAVWESVERVALLAGASRWHATGLGFLCAAGVWLMRAGFVLLEEAR